MSIIYILIPIAVIFTAIAIYLFFWAVKSEQFDDLEKQGMSILFEDEQPSPEAHNANNEHKIHAAADRANTHTNNDTKVNKSE